MFGYVTICKDELKIKDYEFYRSCYCGLCASLRHRHGILSALTLTYDMTFMSMLLSALYETEYRIHEIRCPVHPAKRQTIRVNRMTNYAADMTILLSYHSMQDNWRDEGSVSGLAMSAALKRAYQTVAKRYPRQTCAVELYMKQIAVCERENDCSLDRASGYTGNLLRELFVCKKDIWQEHLGNLAFYLGKFIYLMDAYDDLEKDAKTGNFNPWLAIRDTDGFEDRAEFVLNLMGEMAAKEFEWLPVIENAEILRNILYAGIWTRYTAVRQQRLEKSKA